MIIKLLSIAITFGVILLLGLWQSDFFTEKVRTTDLGPVGSAVSDAREPMILKASEVPIVYRATGTMRSRDEVDISPRVMARILSVSSRSGDTVEAGDLLVELDSTDLMAQTEAARKQVEAAAATVKSVEASLRAVEADFSTVEKQYARVKSLLVTKAVSQSQFDETEGQYKGAQAHLSSIRMEIEAATARKEQAAEALKASEAVLEFSRLSSPMKGVVSERFADPGDLAVAGQPILRIFDPSRLMLQASVRENLAGLVKVGMKVAFTVAATGNDYEGEVREIVPYVDPSTRTFLVKVCLGKSADVRPGMYGELQLQIGTRKILTIPAAYLATVGQLQTVLTRPGNDATAKTDTAAPGTSATNPGNIGRFVRRLVKATPGPDGTFRILAGLSEGDEIAIPEPHASRAGMR